MNDWLLDITNNAKFKSKQGNALEVKKIESNENEGRKIGVKKEGKENENESLLEKKIEKIWLEKNSYNEPLQMQE